MHAKHQERGQAWLYPRSQATPQPSIDLCIWPARLEFCNYHNQRLLCVLIFCTMCMNKQCKRPIMMSSGCAWMNMIVLQSNFRPFKYCVSCMLSGNSNQQLLAFPYCLPLIPSSHPKNRERVRVFGWGLGTRLITAHHYYGPASHYSWEELMV